MAGAPAAVNSRMTTVNCREQACVAALAARAPTVTAASAATAMVATASVVTAGMGEVAAIVPPLLLRSLRCQWLRQAVTPSSCGWFTRLFVDIAGTRISHRGCRCICHKICGMQVEIGTKVMFLWEKVVNGDHRVSSAKGDHLAEILLPVTKTEKCTRCV